MYQVMQGEIYIKKGVNVRFGDFKLPGGRECCVVVFVESVG